MTLIATNSSGLMSEGLGSAYGGLSSSETSSRYTAPALVGRSIIRTGPSLRGGGLGVPEWFRKHLTSDDQMSDDE